VRLVVRVATALALVHVAVIAPLHAQEPPVDDMPVVVGGCALRPDLVRWLGRNFAETPVARGLEANGNLLELFSAARGTTWTIVLTTPAGFSCIVSEGRALEPLRFGTDEAQT
jgi:hypothetical protein